MREVEIMKRVSDFPHVIRYYTSFFEEGFLNIIMEYAERCDLE
jgi:serine/threonine protein kinase